MQSSGMRLSGSSDSAGYVSNGLRTDHFGTSVLKSGLMITGAEAYAKRWRARRRILISILFVSQIDSIALRRVRE